MTKVKAPKAKSTKPLNPGFLLLAHVNGVRLEYDKDQGEFVTYIAEPVFRDEQDSDLSVRCKDSTSAEHYFSALLLWASVAMLRNTLGSTFADRTFIDRYEEEAKQRAETVRRLLEIQQAA